MPDDHEQIVVRRRKLDALRERGIGGYPNDFRPDHTTSEVHARVGGLADAELAGAAPVAVAGRIMAVRDFGKAGFLRLQDRGGVLQLHVRRDQLPEEAFELYRLLDVGDLIGVRGRPFRTRTGELTLEVQELRLLAKSLRPMPEKWHGLQDVEMRYRQRYLDLIANPDARRIFELRSRVIDHVRSFLRARGFLEVETPMMQGVAGGAAARPFVTHHNALDVDLHLRIAPELYLKDRKSTRLNSSHLGISYAVFCLKKKNDEKEIPPATDSSDGHLSKPANPVEVDHKVERLHSNCPDSDSRGIELLVNSGGGCQLPN